MFTTARHQYALLLPLLLLGVQAVLLAPLVGDASDIAAPSARLLDTSPPEPPHQRDDWPAPQSKAPNKFVTAARLLCEQGFADPRGCEYREIEVRTDGGVAPTHGWVLPARWGDEQRYAVCWNGLVYALVSGGKKADLTADVRDAIDRMKKRRRPELGWHPSNEEARSVWHKSLGTDDGLATVLLLRLGEGELASAWWTANHPRPKSERDDPSEPHPYLALAPRFARARFQRLLGAHQRGDDSLALSDGRRLTAFLQIALAEAQAFVPNKESAQFPYLDVLETLPALLADQERRAREGPRPAVVCLGPGRHPDAATRIAALIERLDEMDTYDPYGLSRFGCDAAVVRALIREGEPALEPLLKCNAEDRRLTRASSTFGGDGWDAREYTHVVKVREAALTAIQAILDRLDVEPFATNKFPEQATPQQEAATLRNHIKIAKRMPSVERWFKRLADDANRDGWVEAVERLTRSAPDDEPRTTLWVASAPAVRRDRPTMRGESLRGKTDPPVTELLLRRIDQCDGSDRYYLMRALSQWEPEAALGPLTREMKQLRSEDKWQSYVRCVEARCELGDTKALDDYLAWLRTHRPGGKDTAKVWAFQPMARYPDYPGMAAAATALFDDEQSPWLPLVGNAKGGVHELIPTGLLRLPAFRKAVLKELANKGGEGTVSAGRNGSLSAKLADVSYVTEGRRPRWWRELDIPLDGSKGTFRTCDYVAWIIGERFAAAPQCELYWPEAKRDAAVRDCGEFLRRYGDHLFQRPDVVQHDRPATADDVRAGKAIFWLAGAGEARVVRGLDWERPARWVTLKDHAYETEEDDPLTGQTILVTNYRQDGHIVQAEEVLKDGKWQRYYGFVGSNQVARVLAEEIEFPPREPEWNEPRAWVRVGSGFHVRLEVPSLKVELIDDYPPRLPADAALTFGLVVRNSRGVEQAAPSPEKSVRLRLFYSPETVSRQGALVPQATRDAEWTELTLKPGAEFDVEKGKPLAVVEERKLATVDLRRWFDVSKPGFYRLQLLPVVQETGAVPEISEVRFSLAPPAR